MCKTKMATNVFHPTSPSKRNKHPFKSPSSTTLTNTIMSTSTSTTTATASSLGSSRNSLASLRTSLPENPHLYDISEIRNATNNFLSKNSAPSSSSTRSWHCTLHGKDVLIFQRKSHTQLTPQSVTRKLSSICRSHHVAIINLLGASISGEYIYFVYEFIRGANVYELLHNSKNPEFTILNTWMSRVQIAMDVANGLDYIHNSTGLDGTCVHNHVKSSSVMVKEGSFNGKLCHFGVAELCGEPTEEREMDSFGKMAEIVEDIGVETMSLRRLNRSNSVKFNGTRGYMSPEFQSTGIGTRKADVYAYGVVLIELLSGEEPLKYKLDKQTGEYQKISVVEAAIAVVDNGGEREGRLRKWIDRRLKDSYPVDVAEKLTRLSVDCVHVDPDKRPDMRRVAGKLSKLYLESQVWCERMSVPTDFTVSFAPR